MNAAVLSLLLLFGAGEPSSSNERAFWEVRIELTEEAARSLASEPRKAVNGRVDFGGNSVAARVKLKGHGSFQRLDQKPSFTLHFDDTTAAQVPFGGSKIHLNNSAEDASYLKEKVGSELFRRARIAAPRMAHARVSLNDRALGLYVLKEGFSEEFMLRNFGNMNGTIYDSDSSDQKEVGEQMDVDAGIDSRGQIKLKELWSAANEPDLSKRFDRLDSVLDLESFLKFTAMEVLLCHWDGYAMSQNNFRIHVPENGKIQFLPSGMDQIFAKADFAWKPRFSGKVARALMETEPAQEQYEAAFNSLFPQVLNVPQISNHLTEVVRELSPHLSREEMKIVRSGAKEFIVRIAARVDSLRAQLRAVELVPLIFKNGSAVIAHWEAVGEPEGGAMKQTASNLVIHAGPRTSASWRARVGLPPGRYRLSSQVQTRDVTPLPFGNRQGACLRVVGKNTQSKSVKVLNPKR